jgi:glycine cleavage system H protein
VELPKVGEKFKTEQKFGVIESVKSVSDLFMPIAGEITAINDNLNSEPELVNLDTYKGGWMIKVKIENASEVGSLMSAEDYKKFIVD